MLLMPLVLVASMGWTYHKRACIAKEAFLNNEEVSCCMAEKELPSCLEHADKGEGHDMGFCQNPNCCTDEVLIVEQSITELIQGSSNEVSFASVNLDFLAGNSSYIAEPQTRVQITPASTKPPDRGKPIHILFSCFRC